MADDLQSRLADLARRYQLESVYVFGSRSTETARMVASGVTEPAVAGESDVDIGVQPLCGSWLDGKARVTLTLELEELFGVRQVDLVILSEANALLAADVVRGELLHTEDADAEAESQLYYLRRAGDLAPFYRQQWKALIGSDL